MRVVLNSDAVVMNSDALRDEAIAHLGYRMLLSFDVVTQRMESSSRFRLMPSLCLFRFSSDVWSLRGGTGGKRTGRKTVEERAIDGPPSCYICVVL